MERRACRAKTREGRRCRNAALPGSPYCAIHAEGTRRPTILDGVLPREEIERLEELMADPRVDDAMMVLAYALRQAVAEGADAKEVIRACDSYVGADGPAQDLAPGGGISGTAIEERWTR